jgi:hypothetical protein
MRTTLLALALFSLTKAARAYSGDAGQVWPLPAVEPIPPDDSHDQGIVFDGWPGAGVTCVVKEEGATATIGFGLTGLYYYRWFELGFAYTLQLGSFISQVPGALAGVKIDLVPWFRLELLAESGAYIVSGVGGWGLFTTGGGQAVSPYVGGRAGASFLLGRARRFLLGAWVNAGDAVGHVPVPSAVQTCLLGCSPSEGETFTFGGGSWSMGLRIGGEIAQW